MQFMYNVLFCTYFHFTCSFFFLILNNGVLVISLDPVEIEMYDGSSDFIVPVVYQSAYFNCLTLISTKVIIINNYILLYVASIIKRYTCLCRACQKMSLLERVLLVVPSRISV